MKRYPAEQIGHTFGMPDAPVEMGDKYLCHHCGARVAYDDLEAVMAHDKPHGTLKGKSTCWKKAWARVARN